MTPHLLIVRRIYSRLLTSSVFVDVAGRRLLVVVVRLYLVGVDFLTGAAFVTVFRAREIVLCPDIHAGASVIKADSIKVLNIRLRFCEVSNSTK